VGVAVEGDVGTVAIDWHAEAAVAQVREKLGRLADDGVADRGVVGDGDEMVNGVLAQAAEPVFQLLGLELAHPDERLERLLAERGDEPVAEAAAEALDPGEADAPATTGDDVGAAVEHQHPHVGHDCGNPVLGILFKIVVTQDSHDRDPDLPEVLGEQLRLLRPAEQGEVAGQDERIRPLVGHRQLGA
jgi:hypothetical protein